ncbi:unnamed protein product [Urochloa humidicola]
MAQRIRDDSSPLPPPTAQEVLAGMEKMMNKAMYVSVVKTKIHRFPQSLREMGSAAAGTVNRYVVPSVVAIGPYHHGLPHLQEMEEVKHAAALQFCRALRCSVQEVYEKILSIAGEARRCYVTDDDDDDTSLVTRLSDAEFAAMMFLDGCFLLNFIMLNNELPVMGRSVSCWPTISKDLLLLENQIPWLVLEALTENCNQPTEMLVSCWIDGVMEVYFLDKEKEKKNPFWNTWFKGSALQKNTQDAHEICSINNGDSKPPHILGLLKLRLTHGMPSEKRMGKGTNNSLLRLSSSAVYLSQIGLKLTASTASWFADAVVQKKPLFGELSLTPLFLNEIVARVLVNMVALEVAQATYASHDADGFVVSSYLSVLAMLMDREEDVQQLRARGVLCAHFSNTQTLAFFKTLAQHLRLGYNYFAIVHDIDDYIRRRPVRIFVHRFVYNNIRVIASVLSIASVLAGIFKALYAVKQSS